MANKIKSRKSLPADPYKLKTEKEERVKIKELAKDERTYKILGTLFILIAFFLFISFGSYLFTWQQDQDKVFQGTSILYPSSGVNVENRLGNFGAYISHQFFYKGFGVASFLFCTFFFIVGANLLFARKVFSIARNLRYIIIGLPYMSIALAFINKGSNFPWGGAVGEMSSDWLTQVLGSVGTSVLLLVTGLAYFIWRFNPVFKVPRWQKPAPIADTPLQANSTSDYAADEKKEGVKLYIQEPSSNNGKEKKNVLKSEGGIVVISPGTDEIEKAPQFEVFEKEEDEEMDVAPTTDFDFSAASEDPDSERLPVSRKKTGQPMPELELEIKAVPERDVEPLTPVPGQPMQELYEPTLDLRDYQYPSLDLLEAQGSEKIIQDPAELEANKKQIITTLKNYDIDIKKIFATVGPTVTLYEIVPADGVRISRIKNLEDDIALSLAALGIRIIAPIPGKGTIGIEVPNVKKRIEGIDGSYRIENDNGKGTRTSLVISL